MNMLRFRLFRLCAALLMALLPVTTVFAAKPDVFTFHEEGYFEIDCGSFVAQEEFVQDVRVMVFYDQAGEPDRVEVHFNYVGTVTNSVTGKTLRDPGHYKTVEDLEAGTQTFVGMVYGITVPGEGMVVLDAGRIVFLGDTVPENVIFEAGSYDYLYGGDAVLCAALD
jgi:hypothetical protein